MRRFKLIFQILYVLVFLTILYFSVDILMNTESYLSKIKLSSYIKFPKYVMGLFLLVSILMAVEYVMQQVRIYKLKGKIGSLESEVTDLKAKLYDQSREEMPSLTQGLTDGEESKEEDEE